MSIEHRPRSSKTDHLPSPEEIRRRALAMRGGEPAELPAATDDDWSDWEREREELPAIEQAERAEARELAAADRSKRQADLILDLARSISQRAASANAGSPVAPGKDVPHYLAWSARLACKRLMLRGRSDREIVDRFSLGSSSRFVLPWLRQVREQLYADCRRYFQRGWTIERVFRNYFLGPAEPQHHVKQQECNAILAKLYGEVSRTLSRGTNRGRS